MSETTLHRQQYGARMSVTDQTFTDAVFNVRALIHDELARQLTEWGADSVPVFEEQPFAYQVEEPRRWWEWLLRRPARTYTVRGVEFVAYAYGWSDPTL